MSRLFSPIKLRGVEIRNRIFVSPMCQYSAKDGAVDDWHLVHLGSRAVGGAGLVMAEATAVAPEGRISSGDAGLWSDKHEKAFAPIAAFIKEQGAAAAIQLAHAGRKASTPVPWEKDVKDPWTPLGPTDEPFSPTYPKPRAMTKQEIRKVVERFASATRRARKAGFDVIELHFAHGYLVQEFLSPLVNKRTDEYGGSLDNRMRLALEIARAARHEWPQELPLFARISATDWAEGGWDLPASVALARALKREGVDFIDCSSGGAVPHARIPAGPGYQVPFSETIRRETGVATGAVGLITRPEQAEEIVASGKADAVLLARELLRRPYWPLHAAKALGVDLPWPKQYQRAKD